MFGGGCDPIFNLKKKRFNPELLQSQAADSSCKLNLALCATRWCHTLFFSVNVLLCKTLEGLWAGVVPGLFLHTPGSREKGAACVCCLGFLRPAFILNGPLYNVYAP